MPCFAQDLKCVVNTDGENLPCFAQDLKCVVNTEQWLRMFLVVAMNCVSLGYDLRGWLSVNSHLSVTTGTSWAPVDYFASCRILNRTNPVFLTTSFSPIPLRVGYGTEQSARVLLLYSMQPRRFGQNQSAHKGHLLKLIDEWWCWHWMRGVFWQLILTIVRNYWFITQKTTYPYCFSGKACRHR